MGIIVRIAGADIYQLYSLLYQKFHQFYRFGHVDVMIIPPVDTPAIRIRNCVIGIQPDSNVRSPRAAFINTVDYIQKESYSVLKAPPIFIISIVNIR